MDKFVVKMPSTPPPANSPAPVGSSEKAKKSLEKQKREEERQEKLRLKEADRIRKEEEKRQREEERKRKEAEKETERIRREEEKRKKDEEKETERLKKEEEKRKKDDEREADRLRKEDEKRKKDEEKQKKEEEKKRKDEEKEQERLKREADKRKRDDDKQQEELKKKMKTQKQRQFMHGFLKKPTASTPINGPEYESPETPNFRPFQVKTGMVLAPLHRRPTQTLASVRKELFSVDNQKFEPYLTEIKQRGGRRSNRTEVIKTVDIEVIDPKRLIENPAEAGLIKWRWKLLQFHKNERPPYWGTWKRQPRKVKGRNPFAMEEEIDYDFDSDDEWEGEPEDGEDLGDKDDDDKEEDEKCSVHSGDEDDEDDFLVPHGYLSDDEGGVAEYRDKHTLKTLEEEFYRDLKKDKVNGFPVIETDNLDRYTMIFYPGDDSSDMELGDDGSDIDLDTSVGSKAVIAGG